MRRDGEKQIETPSRSCPAIINIGAERERGKKKVSRIKRIKKKRKNNQVMNALSTDRLASSPSRAEGIREAKRKYILPRVRTLKRCIAKEAVESTGCRQGSVWVFHLFHILFFTFHACQLPTCCLCTPSMAISPPSIACVSAGANDSQRSSKCLGGVGSKSRKVFWMARTHPPALHSRIYLASLSLLGGASGLFPRSELDVNYVAPRKSLAPKHNISTPRQPVLRV